LDARHSDTIARMLARRASFAISAAVVVVALTNPVAVASAQSAESGVKACTTLAEDAQRLRAGGKLLEAREKLMACSTPECPQVVRADCARWASEVLEATPTIVIDLKDGDGKDTFDAKVFVDGRPVADRIDGRPIAIDPGPRTVRVERPDGMKGSQKIVAKENAKGRVVMMVFGGTDTTAPSPTPDPPPSRGDDGAGRGGPLHYAGVAMIVVGAVGITYGVVRFFDYLSDESNLRAQFQEAEATASGCDSNSPPESTCGKNVATREDLRFRYNENEAEATRDRPLVFAAGVGGLLLVAGGVVMFVLAPTTKSAAAIKGGPVVTPHFAGLTIGGSF
jgi:hypothetical protein